MTKLVIDGAAKAANGGKLNPAGAKLSPRDARTSADAQVAADAAAASLAAPVKAAAAAMNAKAGLAPGQLAKLSKADLAKLVKRDDEDSQDPKNNKDEDGNAPTSEHGQGEHLAMVDSASAASAGLMTNAIQDASGDGGSDDDAEDILPIALAVGAAAIGTILLVSGGNGGTPTPVNTPPTFSSTTGTGTVAENSAITTVAVKAVATDANAGDTITYSLTGADAALFAVSATGDVTFKGSPDFETPTDANKDNVYEFNVVATDKAGLTAQQSEKVTVTNVNEAPTVTSAATATSPENTTTAVYTATGKDVDAGDTVTFTIGGEDAALFNVDKTTGAVTFKTAADFENPTDVGKDNVYKFTVTGTDKAGLTSTATAVSLTVTNANDAPTFTSSNATATAIAENGAAKSVVFTAKATDQDAGDTVTYKLGGTDAASFTIDATTGAVTLTNPADFETKPTYTFTVTATDKAGASATQTVTLPVTNVNEAPVFNPTTGTGAAVAENTTGTVVFTAKATDVDNPDTVTYKLGGADAANFTIDSKTGAVTLATALNYEATVAHTYTFTVTATDAGGSTTGTPVTVTGNITDVVDALTLDVGAVNAAVTIDARGPNPPNVTDVNYGFTESPATSEVLITNFANNDFISFSKADAADYTYQKVGNDLQVSFNDGVNLSKITLVGVLTGFAGPIATEADAEAALTSKLGASTNVANGGYFAGTALPETINIPGGTSTFSGAGRAGTFVEDGATESKANLTTFRGDDVIRFINGPANVNDGNLFFQLGTDTKDIQISYLNAQSILSVITLDDVNPNSTAVFDFQTASQVLGRTDFLTFA